LTFKFLGETLPEQIPDIEKAMDDATQGFAAFSISFEGIGSFPSKSRPRVVWIGVVEAAGALLKLQKQLELGMVDLGFPKEKRAFHPHLTLARVRRGTQNFDLSFIANKLDEYPYVDLGDQALDHISLIQSVLKPTGPVYTSLFTSELGGGE
jgi:2'-5' RNA ligase